MDVSSQQHHELPPPADHWQYYGLMTGPMFLFNARGKMKYDFRLGLGAANVHFPVLKVGNLVSDEKWAIAFAVQFGTDLRYHFTSNGFIITNIDLTAMRPGLTFTMPEAGSIEIHQDIDVINFGIGIGFNF